MMHKKSKKAICLAALAALLVTGSAVGSAMAYFTTYAVAEGGVTLELGFEETVPREEVSNRKKEVRIENTGDYDCFVRMKALTGDAHKEGLVYSEPDGAQNWTPEDGYYYYKEIVKPGEMTSQIDVSFAFPEKDVERFNVIIIQESTAVLYDENGNPYADWDAIVDVNQSVYE